MPDWIVRRIRHRWASPNCRALRAGAGSPVDRGTYGGHEASPSAGDRLCQAWCVTIRRLSAKWKRPPGLSRLRVGELPEKSVLADLALTITLIQQSFPWVAINAAEGEALIRLRRSSR